ncbi:hypothetical protein J4558_04195 [Leptolyngbya sp. 15MV]|nr:hypothetical protein J4558_04195 [Leptolyngbya sp. 15MV]
MAAASGSQPSPVKASSESPRADAPPDEALIDRIAAAVVVSAEKLSLAQPQDLGLSFAMHMRAYLGGAPRQLFEERTKRGDTVVPGAFRESAKRYVERGSLDESVSLEKRSDAESYDMLWKAARSEGWRLKSIDIGTIEVVQHTKVRHHKNNKSRTIFFQSSLFNPPGMGVLEFGPFRHEMLESGRAVSIDCEVTFHDGRQGSLFITFALIEDKWRPIGIVYQIFEREGAWPIPMI